MQSTGSIHFFSAKFVNCAFNVLLQHFVHGIYIISMPFMLKELKIM